MATTTTNFGWDIPQSTDLVKDGATAIAALGQDIDTAFVDFKGGTTGQVLKKTSGTDLDVEWGTASSGLTLINTTSFSGVSSQSFNDVFTSSYRNYRIVASNLSGSGFANLQIRMRVSGTDNSSTNYTRQYQSANSTTIAGARATGQTSWAEVSLFNTDKSHAGWLDVFEPQTSGTYTTALNQSIFDGGGSPIMTLTAYGLTVTTSYTGFTALASGGTMTGTISVYGYNN